MKPLPSFSLEGRRALITGAGRGIGRAIADVYAQAGAEVWLCARSGTEIDEAVAEITAAGFEAHAAVCDVTDIDAFKALVEGLPGVDIFVNNAGTNRPKLQVDYTPADFDHVVGLNLRAAFFALQAVSTRMIADGRGGAIINMSSQMGHTGAVNRTLYCMTKWGIEGLTKATSLELAPHGIRINTICPTFIETPLTKPYFENPDFLTDTLRKIKLGRLGQVEDLTGAALYLASDASGLVTGTSILVDGGWTAG